MSATGVVKITNFCKSRVLSGPPHRAYTREVITSNRLEILFMFRVNVTLAMCHDVGVQVVRMWYRAPELLLGDGQYGSGIDMWALGVVFAEMTRRGEVLFPCMSEVDLMFYMFR